MLSQLAPLFRRKLLKIFSANDDFAAGWRFETDECAQQSAFAGTGTAQDYDGFARGNVESNAMKNFSFAVGYVEIANGDRRFLPRIQRDFIGR